MTERIPTIRTTVMPPDLNSYGGAFGGWIFAQMSLAASSLASRISKGKTVVVAANDIHFPAGLLCGDELSIYCDLERQGRTSMTIAVEATRRERESELTQLAATGRLTFVAVDADNRPRPFTPATQEG